VSENEKQAQAVKSLKNLFIIKQEYQDSVPALTAEEYKSLVESIKSEGQHLPIIVNKELVILDGYHRFKICQQLELAPKYEIKEFPTLAQEQLFVIDCNLQRRQLTPYVRGILALRSAIPVHKRLSILEVGEGHE
jgi:ParB-like chromosome segregation protein Spo0J